MRILTSSSPSSHSQVKSKPQIQRVKSKSQSLFIVREGSFKKKEKHDRNFYLSPLPMMENIFMIFARQ